MTEDYILVLETTRRAFVYANEHNWDGLLNEVFADKVTVDDSSYPGAPKAVTHTSTRLIDNWKEVFTRIPHTRHLLNNELVTFNGNIARVHTYVTGIHAKQNADEEPSKWIVYSTYDVQLIKNQIGWRINYLKQNFLFQEGHPSQVILAS